MSGLRLHETCLTCRSVSGWYELVALAWYGLLPVPNLSNTMPPTSSVDDAVLEFDCIIALIYKQHSHTMSRRVIAALFDALVYHTSL